MKLFEKRGAVIFLLFMIIAGSFGSGYFAALDRRPEIDKVAGIENKQAGNATSVDFAPFWKVWNTLNQKYVPTKKSATTTAVTDQEKVWGAIQGLTASLGDPYTVFFPPADEKIFQSEIAGNFEGVGMEVGLKGGVLTVISPLKDNPASRAGMKSGDKILKIDGVLTLDLGVDKAVGLIRGKKGTTVTLLVAREDQKTSFEVKIVRDTIHIPTVDTEMRKDGVFVIHLYTFTGDSPNLFRKALQEFIDAKTDKLIIDLRGNPGGYLDAAVDMASFFLPKGAVVVRENYGKGIPEDVFESKGYAVFNANLKLALLIDSGSASASEILAGALQEHKVAKLVGTKSFGKGSVQELVKVTPDTSLKVTIARWLTPNGVSISEGGLTPDVLIKAEVPVAGKIVSDVQLEKAAEILKKK